ncbi:MAG: copper amine oxidase N-terminal domain-containing protein [Heliobacteriaceae bacterium]|nr:copper amine oxidase N-terminal domain-containing protein [Heliobacteriaceae bacterium]MDD4588557.1 copper amine oxidase N-terminal domain-containing protein [Heliobacteriaceae bacterium]
MLKERVKTVKQMRKGLVLALLLVLAGVLAGGLPAAAEPVKGYFGSTATVIPVPEAELSLLAPAKVYSQAINVEVNPTDYSRLVPQEDYYVTRSVDISMKNKSGQVITATNSPVCLRFKFYELDYIRASRSSGAPVTNFGVGFWDEKQNAWATVPAEIFWNGTTGQVEGKSLRGYGRYALIWSNAGQKLSDPAPEGFRLIIDGETVQSAVSPFIKPEGYTMVPLRLIANNLGAQVKWDGTEGRIDIDYGKVAVKLWAGKLEALKNNEEMTLAVAPEIIDGTTFVPLGFVAKSLGIKADWDPLTRTVYLFK